MMPSPRLLWRHVRLFRPDRRKRLQGWPFLQAERSFHVEVEHLRRFRQCCPGWAHDAWLPPTYPQVVAADLHLRLLGERDFPFNPMGLVHFSNRIGLLGPMPVEGDYRLQARLSPGGEHPRGTLVDVETEMSNGGEPVWRSVATALRITRNRPPDEESKDKSPGEERAPASQRSIDLAEDLGRRYALIAGDLNPIHQRAWMARPFGFPRPIIHGMWTLAWAVQPLLPARPEQPLVVEAEFTRPLLLPASIHSGTDQTEQGIKRGRVWTETADRPNLLFRIHP
jgi:acyl dehydratase